MYSITGDLYGRVRASSICDRGEIVKSLNAMSIRKDLFLVATLCSVLTCGCATPGNGDGYNAFLQQIAAGCKPLVIGSDDMGQAIVTNGLGAIPDHYNNFIEKTAALYGGGISPQLYRESLTAFVGAGSSNQRSFDCIIAHLPAKPQGAPATPK